MYRFLFTLVWLTFPAQSQPAGQSPNLSLSQRFFQQHQQSLHRQFSPVASESELKLLLGYILDQQLTDVEPNNYFRSRPAPLTVLLAQRRGGADYASLAEAVIYPLLRFVLPNATPKPAIAHPASAGDRAAVAAYAYLGVRYGPPTYNSHTNQGTLDCSGLVNRVLTDVGLPYERGGGTGATEGIVNSPSFQTVSGTPQPGDLLARQHGGHWRHVGIYVGNGYLIEAPYRGTVVRRVAYRPEKWLRILRYSGAGS